MVGAALHAQHRRGTGARSLRRRNPARRPKAPGGQSLGWIAGTFSLDSLGMIGRNNYFDAPDLVVSFRELPDADNRGLTGPAGPTYVFDEHGEQRAARQSFQTRWSRRSRA